jgi:hypothetical protein
MHRPTCSIIFYFSCFFFRRHTYNRRHTQNALLLLRTTQLLRLHDICTVSVTIASVAASGCRDDFNRDYRACPDEGLLCCRCRRRCRLSWPAARAQATPLSTGLHPATARVLSAWRAMHRFAC